MHVYICSSMCTFISTYIRTYVRTYIRTARHTVHNLQCLRVYKYSTVVVLLTFIFCSFCRYESEDDGGSMFLCV